LHFKEIILQIDFFINVLYIKIIENLWGRFGFDGDRIACECVSRFLDPGKSSGEKIVNNYNYALAA